MVRTKIQASQGVWALGLGELWSSRGLLFFLVWRNVTVRYKQTVLGVTWAVLQPALTMIVFSLFFGKLAKIPSDGLPYPIFSYTALVPWTFFANGIGQAAASLEGSANLLRKVYFPRIIIPMSSILSCLVDLAMQFGLLVAMMVFYGVRPRATILLVVPLLVLSFATALGVGLFFSALNVRYRDVRLAMPFFLQIWMFATPVVYPSSLLPEPWRTIYGINPMVGVIEGFRWALLGTGTAPGPGIAVSCVAACAFLAIGWIYFRTTERAFADYV